MENIMLYVNDKGRLRAESVRWAIQLFNDGICEYYEESLNQFHESLLHQTRHLHDRCLSSCSKHKAKIEDWCTVCSTWRTAILSKHNYRRSISNKKFEWSRVDSAKWPSDINEVVKIFLPEWCKGTEDTDDISIRVNVMISCMSFGNYVQLQKIRDIRNHMAHETSLSEKTKKEFIQKLLACLKMDKLRKYPSVEEATKSIELFITYDINDIIENGMLKEEERQKIERKLYSKTDRTWMTRFLPVTVVLLAFFGIICAISCEVYFGFFYESDCERLERHHVYFFEQHRGFTGREWLKSEIMKKVTESEKGLILVAGPGFGKSALIADIIQNYNADKLPLLGFHVCQHDSPRSHDASKFVRNLSTMLKCKVKDIENIEDSDIDCTFDPTYCFNELIAKHVKSLEIKQRFVLIIDGLDECQSSDFRRTTNSIVDLLSKYHDIFGEITKMLITSRNDSDLISRLHFLKKFYVPHNHPNHTKDMVKFVANGRHCEEGVIEEIVEKTENNFLILRYYDQYLKEDCTSDALDSIPNSISEMYDVEFRRLYDRDFTNEYHLDRSFFEILITKQMFSKPLTIAMMKDVMSIEYPPLVDEYEFSRLLRRIKPHLIRVSDDSEIHLVHTTLRDWLLARRDLSFYINEDRGHFMWIRYFHATLKPQESIPEVKGFDVENDPSGIFDAITLAVHYSRTNNETLLSELRSGNIKIQDRKEIQTSLTKEKRREDFSQITTASILINDFKLMEILLLLSNTKDVSKEAHYSLLTENHDSVRALIQSGLVDMKRKHLVSESLAKPFPKLVLSVYQDEIWRDIGTNQFHPTSSISLIVVASHINATSREQVDFYTILHTMTALGYSEGISYLMSIDDSLVHEKTANGWDVLDLAVYSDNYSIFQYFTNFIQIGSRHWYLLFASHLGSDKLLGLFLQNGFTDLCPRCNESLYKVSSTEYIIYPSSVVVSRNSSFSIADAFKLRQELTCTTALMAAVRAGNAGCVELLLNYSPSCLECKDFSGMTPLAAAIYHKQEEVVGALLSGGPTNMKSNMKPAIYRSYSALAVKLNFSVTPTAYKLRVSLLNKFFLVPSENPWRKEYLLGGANLIHLASLRPTAISTMLAQVLVYSFKNRIEALDTKDAYGRTPLYYSICHPDADNVYNTLKDYSSPKAHRMAMFLVKSKPEGLDFHETRDLGLFRDNILTPSTLLVVCYNSTNICNLSPSKFPELKEINLVEESRPQDFHGKRYIQNFKACKGKQNNYSVCFSIDFNEDVGMIILSKIRLLKNLYGKNLERFLHLYEYPLGQSVDIREQK